MAVQVFIKSEDGSIREEYAAPAHLAAMLESGWKLSVEELEEKKRTPKKAVKNDDED